jgi:hypothetical protein
VQYELGLLINFSFANHKSELIWCLASDTVQRHIVT